MMCGRRNPELGGHRDALDIVGINYYWTNQWQLGGDTTPLASDDPRRLPLASLVRRAFDRYGSDVVITETSELGDARRVGRRARAHDGGALRRGRPRCEAFVSIRSSACPEWHERSVWTRMGLWISRSAAACSSATRACRCTKRSRGRCARSTGACLSEPSRALRDRDRRPGRQKTWAERASALPLAFALAPPRTTVADDADVDQERDAGEEPTERADSRLLPAAR